ncbi:hypothetical protein GUJ93_ZPchr0009g536 [Zizania palustris]|uniref:Uncharacterized protein n=1 Tax=Zizania palustris TaxID=103762 RepID=A0A8J5RXT2_ZIZPA|nr:hypothetical protein GUJ93_ZPchr0009g536 [Zizania palustris]
MDGRLLGFSRLQTGRPRLQFGSSPFSSPKPTPSSVGGSATSASASCGAAAASCGPAFLYRWGLPASASPASPPPTGYAVLPGSPYPSGLGPHLLS